MAGRTGPPRSGKVDATQAAHVDALEAVGVIVALTSSVGDGFNDLVCIMPEATFLIEVKQLGEQLTPSQKRWHERCKYRNHVSYSPEQSVEIAMFYRRTRKAA